MLRSRLPSIMVISGFMFKYGVRRSFADSEAIPSSIDQEEKDEWEIEKEKCSFCRQFLQSPCRNQFKLWSKCVDASKENGSDFVEVCESFTNELLNCTAENPDFFASLRGQSSDEEENGSDSEEVLEHVEPLEVVEKENVA